MPSTNGTLTFAKAFVDDETRMAAGGGPAAGTGAGEFCCCGILKVASGIGFGDAISSI